MEIIDKAGMSRRNNLQFLSIRECDHEKTDNLILSILQDKIRLHISLNTIERSYSVGKKLADSNR